MGKWNFDVIFEGSAAQQRDKAAYFTKGLQRRAGEHCTDFADAVMRGEARGGRSPDTILNHLGEFEEALKAFTDDPRLAALTKRLEDEAVEAGLDRFKRTLRDAIARATEER